MRRAGRGRSRDERGDTCALRVDGETGAGPRVEASDQIGGAPEAEVLQGHGGQARGVTLGAEEDHVQVVRRRLRDSCLAGRVEPPLKHVTSRPCATRADRAARGLLHRGQRHLDPRPPHRAGHRRRATAALAAVEPHRLRPLPGVGLRRRHHRRRGVRGQAHVGLLRRLHQPAAQRVRLPRGASRRTAAHRVPRPPVRPGHPRQQGVPGRLALEGGADRGMERVPRCHPGGAAALQELPRGEPPRSALPLPRHRAPAAPAPRAGGGVGHLLRPRSSPTPASSPCWCSTRTSPATTPARSSVCSSASGFEPPADASKLEPPLKQQSDAINDDWVRRYSETKLATEFDLTPAPAAVPG